jgi:hypothetical protein
VDGIPPPVNGVEQRLDVAISLLRDIAERIDPSHSFGGIPIAESAPSRDSVPSTTVTDSAPTQKQKRGDKNG